MEEVLIENTDAQPAERVEVVDIQFRSGQKVYFFDPAGMTFRAGDHVIIDTARGPEYGICAGGNHLVGGNDVVQPLRSVIRLATAHDEKIMEDNRAREKKAYDICLQKIAEHGLDMQLVSAECAFDGSKILFFFTADERVDFRELVKNLASIFHTRIELRQIGVRDKAKMVGGLGICGRPFCCASFLEDFQPVSIKMAKTQSLSLNPTKISGTCGRLMCCLKYEQDAYEDLLRRTPKEESYVDTPEGRGVVTEISLLRQRVKVRLDDSPETVKEFLVEEIAVWRNGKAKKNDPPIPEDWAPISGGGKRKPRLEKIEPEEKLEPIRFRYRQEAVAEEEAPEQPSEEAPKPNKPRRQRERKPQPEQQPKKDGQEVTKPQPKKETPEAAKQQPKKEQPKKEPPKKQPKAEPTEPEAGEATEEGAKKTNRRPRPNYRHRRPKAPQSPKSE